MTATWQPAAKHYRVKIGGLIWGDCSCYRIPGTRKYRYELRS